MILSDEGIRRALASGELEITPAPAKDDYSPSAVDITVGPASTFYRWKREVINAKGTKVILNLSEQSYPVTARFYSELVTPEPDGSIILPPYEKIQQVMLCQTLQTIRLKAESKLAARVEGRSSLARLGLMVHMTAPTVHSTFNSTITLEMVNHGPFYLQMIPNHTRLCQFIIERLETTPEEELKSFAQGQTDPRGKAPI